MTFEPMEMESHDTKQQVKILFLYSEWIAILKSTLIIFKGVPVFDNS